MKTKQFKTAPLPFLGQKRRFINQVKEVIKDCPNETIYVDLFGGSGLLSYTIKQEKPNAKVVYNDFDNYSQRIENIDYTNALISDIRLIVEDCPKDKKIAPEVKQSILERVKHEERTTGYVDYITVSSSILFSMKYSTSFEDLEKQTFYNCVRQSDYDATGYLDGLTVVSKDYKQLYEEYKSVPNVLFLVDPPYLSTDVSAYKENYWKLTDYLDVLNVLDGSNYIYFTSNKSQIVELCNWLDTRRYVGNPFAGAKQSSMVNAVNYSSSYTDIMMYKV